MGNVLIMNVVDNIVLEYEKILINLQKLNGEKIQCELGIKFKLKNMALEYQMKNYLF